MKSVYVASSLYNADMVRAAYDELREAGLRISYDWTTHGLVSDRSRLRDIANKEIEGVASADYLLFLTPARTGSHVELGIAIALKKPIYMMLPGHNAPNIELKTFYFAETVKLFDNYTDAINKLISDAKSN